MRTRTWSSYLVVSKYSDNMQYYMILLKQWGNIVAKFEATVNWVGEDQIHVCSFMWLDHSSAFFVKRFLPSFFNSVNFWSSRAGIVLDNELADQNNFRELGVFVDGKIQGHSFRPPRNYEPTKQAFWCTKNAQNCVEQGRLNYSELANNLSRAVKSEYSAKRTENCKILGNLLDKEAEYWKTIAVLKIKISLIKKSGFVRVTHSDTRPHVTVQIARQKCLVTG